MYVLRLAFLCGETSTFECGETSTDIRVDAAEGGAQGAAEGAQDRPDGLRTEDGAAQPCATLFYLPAVGWVLRGYSEQYSGFQTGVVFI